MLNLTRRTSWFAAALPFAAFALETGELDLNFGQQGTVSINALTGANNALCENMLRVQNGLVLGCQLDTVNALVFVTDEGRLNPLFGQNGIAVLPPTGLFGAGSRITAIGPQADGFVIVQVQQTSVGFCSNITLITRITNAGQPVPLYGGFASGYRILESESTAVQGFRYCAGNVSAPERFSTNAVHVNLPVGPINTVPALASLAPNGALAAPFGSITRVPQFRFVGKTVPNGTGLIGGNGTNDATLLAKTNAQGAVTDTWSPSIPNLTQLSFRDLATVEPQPFPPTPPPPSRLRTLSYFTSPSGAGLVVSASNFESLDHGFNANGALGPNRGHAIIPATLYAPSPVGADRLLTDDNYQTLIFSYGLSQARLLRLTARGELDPEFRSGAQPGVIILNIADQQNVADMVVGSSVFGANQVSYLVVAPTTMTGFPLNSSVSRLRGFVDPSPIFKNGFEP